MHDLLKKEIARAAAGVVLALAYTLWAVAGMPLKSRRGVRLQLVESRPIIVLATLAGAAAVAFAVTRWRLLRRRLAGLQATQGAHFFLRAAAARRIHALLLAVAARDGAVGAAEREVVHAVLTRRLPDRVLPQDLRSWSAAGAGRLDAIAHARHLAAVLAPDERAALLQWCQEVAAADGAVAAAEAELLQRFAEVLRTPRPVQSLAERE
ncbi:MAG: TerB family tellurite resistance protein [Planctomycetota bacterium]|jgi:uncharacterized tellurite resistance protein B-like protein